MAHAPDDATKERTERTISDPKLLVVAVGRPNSSAAPSVSAFQSRWFSSSSGGSVVVAIVDIVGC